MQVNMHEAKSQLSKLAERVHKGEEVIIAKAGVPYLYLMPYKDDKKPRVPGRYKDQIQMDKSTDSGIDMNEITRDMKF